MVKRMTQYRTQGDRPIYSENGEFYYTRNNGATWRRLINNARYYTLLWDPNDPNNSINRANLNNQGSIANLKANFNWAARTIQRVARERRTRRAATTIQRHVRGARVRARGGVHNPHTPAGHVALMLRAKRHLSKNKKNVRSK